MPLLSKDFFQVQADFAESLVKKHHISYEEAYFDHIAFYVRCIGHSDEHLPNPQHPKWLAILEKISQSPEQCTEVVYQEYVNFEKNKPQIDPPKVCFHTFYHQDKNKYELHFDPIDPQGNLSANRKEQRLKELTEMFQQIATERREDATLFVRTWLFDVEAFTRLFPSHFVQRAENWQNGNRQYDNTHWGQLYNKEKQMKWDMVEKFKQKYQSEIHEDFNLYFPLSAKYSELPVEDFFQFYGVK